MLAKRLESLRRSRKLTQKQIAEKLGIARTTYSGYENKSREPDHETLQKIADYYEVTTDYLLGRDQTKDTGPGYLLRTNPEVVEELLREFDRLSEKDQNYIADLIKRLSGAESN